jgi:hypothetical protein
LLELLKNYSVGEIIIFIVLLALAVKEVVSFIDWTSSRLKLKFTKDNTEEQNIIEIKEQITQLSVQLSDYAQGFNNHIKEYNQKHQELCDAIALLTESDKDDIKAWITEKHHYFVYEKGYIDDYNLDCMEKRFKHYVDEKGNSFAEDLMNEVRALPKVIQQKEKK